MARHPPGFTGRDSFPAGFLIHHKRENIMAIKLGNNPKSFKKDITVISVAGVSDVLKITYIYRDRKGFAILLDERKAANEMLAAELKENEQKEPAVVEIISSEAAVARATGEAVAQVLDIANGWDLIEPFTKENLEQLENDFPGALSEIQNQYQNAVLGLRVKN